MKKLIYGSILILVAGGIVFALKARKNSDTHPPYPSKVIVGYKRSVPSFPIFVGINNGYFTKRGLEIETIPFDSTNQMIEAVVKGDIDASAVGAVEPSLAAEIIVPGSFKFYGQVRWSKDNFLDYLVVKKDSSIGSVSELRGKKIGVAPGGASVIYTRLFLKSFFNPEEAVIEQLEPKLLIQALESGSIDALIGNEPLGAIAVQKGVGRVLLERPYTDYVPYLPEVTGVGLLSSKFIGERPDMAKRFVEAMNESFEFGNHNADEAKKILPSCCGVSEGTASFILHLGEYSGAEKVNKEALQKFADFLFEERIIEKRVETNNLIYVPNK